MPTIQSGRQEPANSWINAGTSLGMLLSSQVALLTGDFWRSAWLAFTDAAMVIRPASAPAHLAHLAD